MQRAITESPFCWVLVKMSHHHSGFISLWIFQVGMVKSETTNLGDVKWWSQIAESVKTPTLCFLFGTWNPFFWSPRLFLTLCLSLKSVGLWSLFCSKARYSAKRGVMPGRTQVPWKLAQSTVEVGSWDTVEGLRLNLAVLYKWWVLKPVDQ